MRRLFFSATLFLCSLLTFAQFNGTGSGTENDPYLIFNPIQLNQMRNFLGQSGVYFKLMADIDLTEYIEDEYPSQGWLPIGNTTSFFQGVLDGDDHTITGLWINRNNYDYVGLFGYTKKAQFKNLNIENANIEGQNYVGSFSGQSYDVSFLNCSISGKIKGKSYIGGCVGSTLNSSSISNIRSTAEIEGDDYVGGIIGYCYASISNCYANSTIVGNNYVGGVVGSCSKMENCSFDGKVIGNGDNVGGLCGFSKKVFTSNAVAFIEGNTSVGGLVGSTEAYGNELFNNCSFSGVVKGTENVGGVVGLLSGGKLIHCFVEGNIKGQSNVGGLCGKANATSIRRTATYWEKFTPSIKSSVVQASCINATKKNVGRICGFYIDDTEFGVMGTSEENKSFNKTIVAKQGIVQDIVDDSQNGTGAGKISLKMKATYEALGWDFNEVWSIRDTESNPYLRHQTVQPIITSNVISGSTTISGTYKDGGIVRLEIDGAKQEMACSGNVFTFAVSPLQAGHEVRVRAKDKEKQSSCFVTEIVTLNGKGTNTNPYLIYNASDLKEVYHKGYFLLMNDIDLTEYISQFSSNEGWSSFGREGSDTFSFDGNGYKISGLWCNSDYPNTGLFSCFSNGSVKNLYVETANGLSVYGCNNTGILIGKAENVFLDNCHVTGSVSGGTNVGGMAGVMDGGKMNNCQSIVSITTQNDNVYVGGLAGVISNSGEIVQSSSIVNVITNNSVTYIGGLVGEMTSGEIDQCYTTGILAATGTQSYVGGLVGKNLANITNCHSEVSITSSYNAAGLVAYNYGLIEKCYASGNIFSNNYAAGIVGYNDGENAVVRNCAAMNNKIEVTYESQQVQQGGGYGQRTIGGLKNSAPTPDMNNYALNTMQVLVNDVVQKVYDDVMNGTAKTEAELKRAVTYQGLDWDFLTIWSIDEDESYPYLSWVTNSTPITEMTLDKSTLAMIVGDTETLTASVDSDKINWTSTNEQVATVEDGIVTAVSEGTADIIVILKSNSNITATCRVTVSEDIEVAIAELQVLVDQAQALYDNSTEGEDIGQYASGSRAALLAIITSVRARISSTMNSEAISECTTEIREAIALFESQRVTEFEDTNYSQIDNTLYIERTEASAGSQVQLSIKMKNTVEIQGYQFDLYLPDGVTVATDVEGFPMVELSTERTTARKTDYFDSSIMPDGHLIVMCGSTKGYTFEGNDGEVALVTLDVADNMEEGEYAIIMRNVALTDPSATSYDTDFLKSTLEVFTYKLGDVNADTKINVADFIAVANHILGNTPPVFVYKAADVNLDTKINVADFIGIANMILSGTTSANNGRMMLAPKRTVNVTPTDIDELDNAIYIDPVTAVPGTQQVLSVKMKNAAEVVGFEFNLQLPEGISIAQEDGFELVELSTERTTSRKTNYFDYKMQNDGTLKVLCGTSAKNPDTGMLYTFEGNDGEVARITIDIPNDYEGGEYAIHVLNGFLADINAEEIDLETDIISKLTVEAGDGRIHFSETDTSLPSFTFGEKADVTVTRTINANEWSTICLPFGMTVEQIEEAFPETNVQLADFIGCGEPELDDEDEVMSFSFIFSTNVTEIEPNHPYLIKVDKKVESFEVDGVTITPSDELSIDLDEIKWRQGAKWFYDYNSFIGTYEAQTVVPEDCLFLNGNKFWYSTGATKMKAFRGYFYSYNILGDAYKYGTNSNVSLTFNDADGILSVKVGDLPTEGTYDLQGRKVVGSLKRGIYIVDGKKMVIK